MKNPLLVLLFILSTYAIVSTEAVATFRPEIEAPQLTFFCELPTTDLGAFFANDTLIQLIQQLKATIAIGTIDLSEERAHAVQTLMAHEIPVVAWLLVPKNEGYWENMDNYENVTNRYSALTQWVANYSLTFVAVGLDMEVDYRDLNDSYYHKWINIEHDIEARTVQKWEDAKAAYLALIAIIKQDYPVQTYILPFILDERQVGSNILQRVTGIVDVGQTVVNVEVPMLYTSLFPDGPGWLYSYTTDPNYKVEAIGLGSTGGAGQVGGKGVYANWTQLERDLLYSGRISPNLYIYSLEGSAATGYLDQITQLDWSQSLTAEETKLLEAEGVVVSHDRELLRDALHLSLLHVVVRLLHIIHR